MCYQLDPLLDFLISNNQFGNEGTRVKKSLTARVASPWATASSGSGMKRLDTEACTQGHTETFMGLVSKCKVMSSPEHIKKE